MKTRKNLTLKKSQVNQQPVNKSGTHPTIQAVIRAAQIGTTEVESIENLMHDVKERLIVQLGREGVNLQGFEFEPTPFYDRWPEGAKVQPAALLFQAYREIRNTLETVAGTCSHYDAEATRWKRELPAA